MLSTIQGTHGIPAALAAVEAELARRSGKRDLASFVKQAWPYVSSEPLLWSWYLDAICIHLEAAFRGEIKRLAINIGPGHAKSLIVSVLFPAWVWTQRASSQFICASHSASFSSRDSIKCRSLIESEWYRKSYADPAGWRLRHDQNAKDLYQNTAHGHRLATSIDGGTGERADFIILDDPTNIAEAHSAAHREKGIRFIREVAPGRFNDMKRGMIIMIMQRVHEHDPTGWALKQGGWVHLCLPEEFDPKRLSITHRTIEKRNGHIEYVKQELWRDPRTEPGELLCAARWPKRELDDLKISMTPSVYAGQYLQNPTPLEGNLFKLADWRFWTPTDDWRQKLGYLATTIRPDGCVLAEDKPGLLLDIDELEEIILSIDCAGGEETTDGSYTVIQVWGKLGARRPLLYSFCKRMDFTDTVTEILRIIRLFPEARRRRIEAKAAGSSIVNTLTRQHGVTGLEPVNPGKRSKEDRARAMQPYQRAGNVELPEGAQWVEDHVHEHAMFPRGASDDQVDVQSQGLEGFEVETTTMDAWARSLGGEDGTNA